MSQHQISDLFLNETGSTQYQVGGLFINETAGADTDKFLSASSNLALDHDVGYLKDHAVGGADTLTFTQDVGLIRDFGISASSTLSLTDEAQGSTLNDIEVSAESTLILTDAAVNLNEISLDAANSLTLGQQVELGTSEWGRKAMSVLTTLTDTARVKVDRTRLANNSLTLSQSVGFALIPASGVDLSAESELTFTQIAEINPTGDAVSVLNLTQAAMGVASKPTDNHLALSQVAGLTIDRASVPAQSSLNLTQAVAFVIERATVDLCRYEPFIGGGQMPPEMIAPTPGITARFALIYPADGTATDTVELRAPNLGNRHRLRFDRIVDETRGGTLIVYADPIWPKVQTLVVQFSALKRTEAYELLRFMREHNGEEIKLTDWEQRVWRGVITTPDEPVSQSDRTGFTAGFEFEGELVPAS